MEIPVLNVEKRNQFGKESTSKLRKEGRIPGVCYGRGIDTINVSLDTDELITILKGPQGVNSLIKLNGIEDRTVFVQKLQHDPVERNIIHVDFLNIDTNKPIQRNVPIEIAGKPEGAKAGGILQVTGREILIEALPHNIPQHLIVDVESLQIGQSIHVKQVPLPEGVTAIYERNYSVCTVISPVEEPTAEAEEAKDVSAEATTEDAEEKPGSPKPAEDKAGGEKK